MWDQDPVGRMFLIPMWHPVLIADLTPEWTPLGTAVKGQCTPSDQHLCG
jgi:hypothetical protein